MKNSSLRLSAILLAALLMSSCLAGRYMCNYSLKPKPHGLEDIERTRHKADSLMPGSTAWYDSLKVLGVLKDTTITGHRDFKVHACFVPAKDPATAGGTAIVVHGYSDNHIVFLYLVRMYRDEFNYNVLFPDLQYQGYSEGDAVQMGWHDRYDVEKWTEVAHEIFRDDFMVVHGVSMGGATVMMMSGDPQPYYVRAFIEDCGYSSVYDQFAHNLKQMFPLIPKGVLNSASLVCEKRYGWSFKEASSIRQVGLSTLPMLFIHGDADDFVPFSDLQRNYDAKTLGYKEMWVAPGAVHANSYAKYPHEYTRHVREFLEKVKAMY